jgi:transcriptional regulator GlxA family with amidase domain
LRLAEDRADFLRVTGELERLKPVIEYVEAHLAGALKLRDLAAIAHLSEPHLHTVFRRIVGQSPMAFVHDQRLKRARLLLSTSDQPIKAVAASCGYPDPFHFSRTFRAAAGLSPREYRARSRNHLAGPA